MNIKSLDLNLLKIFEAIFREKNLTNAALEMSLSQPAISHSLSRLRVFFNDPLFVREANMMVPTTRAESIYQDVKQSLKIIQKVLENKGQDIPANSSRTFVIGISNYCSMAVLPNLLSELSKKAPDIKIRAKHLTLKQKNQCLEEGSMDLVIAGSMNQKTSLKQQKLFSDEEVCIAGELARINGDFIDLANIGLYPLIRYQVSQQEKVSIFQKLDAKKIRLRASIITDQELIIPQLVSSTNHLGIVGKKIALKYKENFKLKILPIRGIDTQFSVKQFWHMRQDKDPVHSWFRKLVKAVGQQVSQED